MVNSNKRIISPEVCNRIVSTIDSNEFVRLDNSMQSADKIVLTEKWILELLNEYHIGYTIPGYIIGFRYHTNDFLEWHRDDMYSKDANLTGGVFLNTNYEGGLFEFEDKTTQPQIAGLPFTITRTVLHRVQPVISGTRYSLHYILKNKVRNLI